MWHPGQPRPLDPARVDVWHVDLDVWANAEIALSPVELEREAQYGNALLAARYAASRRALRSLLGCYLALPAEAIRFETSARGKPALSVPERPEAPAFNVSHTGGIALIAVAQGQRVGVDIERIRPGVDVLAVAARVLGSEVARALSALSEPEQTAGFFAAWTRHEAVIKGAGEGLARAALALPATWKVVDLDVGSAHRAALAHERDDVQIWCASWEPPA